MFAPLLDVESVEAARAVVALDPLVGSGVFEYRLYEWRAIGHDADR